mgnify:CR=1 FL=1
MLFRSVALEGEVESGVGKHIYLLGARWWCRVDPTRWVAFMGRLVSVEACLDYLRGVVCSPPALFWAVFSIQCHMVVCYLYVV